jgi:hypothetical protein
VTTPNAPIPAQPPEPGEPGTGAEQAPTAKAELQILLFSTEQIRTKPTSHLQLTLVAILVIGTLFGSASAHLSPVMTAVIVTAELVTALGIAGLRRTSRRR